MDLDLKAAVGRKSANHSYLASEEKLRAFCAAVGAPYRGEAPPTFMTVFRQAEFELLDQMGIPLRSVLHADQEFRYSEPIRPGDEIEYQAVVSRAFEKTGSSGAMRFLVFDTEVHIKRDQGNLVAGNSKTTIVSR
jgi:hypothetical protein